jgi:transcriptional regulator with GAF, ATPase, and Fis domain
MSEVETLGKLRRALPGIQQLLEGYARSAADTAEKLASEEADPARRVRLERLRSDALGLAAHLQRTYLRQVEEALEELAGLSLQTRMGRLALRLLERLRPDFTPLDLCRAVLDDLLGATQARRGYLVLCRTSVEEVEVVAARDFASLELTSAEYTLSRSMLEPCLVSGQTLRVDEARTDARFSSETSVVTEGMRSALVVPLKAADRVIGALYLENNALAQAFTAEDEALLEAFGSILAANLASMLRIDALQDEKRQLLDELRTGYRFGELIGQSPLLQSLLQTIAQVADTEATVLIEGESGTGKELVARALHANSRRANAPFVALNCAAVPESLLESELFGHEKGAFTGALNRKIGRFEQANAGTLFLDEVSSMPSSLQAKLLRVLQEREIERLGGLKTVPVDVRVVAATNQNLEQLVREGTFREDLFYRLHVIPLRLPPLRERVEDIPLLATHFVAKYSAGTPKQGLTIAPEVLQALEQHNFPGNVRELENLIQRMVLLCRGDRIRLEDLPPRLRPEARSMVVAKDPVEKLLRSVPRTNPELKERKNELKRLLKSYGSELERRFAEAAVERAGGNVSKAAQETGMHRVQLHALLRRKKGAEPTGT